MRILCLHGSPRKEGNSSTLAAHYLEKAAALGSEIKTIYLHQLTYSGCLSCNACKNRLDKCCIKDDLASVLEAMYSADTMIITTPVYFGGICSKVAAFIERTCSLFKVDWAETDDDSRLPSGKKLLFVQSQGLPEEDEKDLYQPYDHHFKLLGFTERKLLRVCGLNEFSDIRSQREIFEQIENLAILHCS